MTQTEKDLTRLLEIHKAALEQIRDASVHHAGKNTPLGRIWATSMGLVGMGELDDPSDVAEEDDGEDLDVGF